MISGWLAFVLFIIAVLIIYLIKKKSILHCIFSYAAAFMCLIHTMVTFYSFSFSEGYISLITILIITASGIAMRHFPGFLGKNYKVIRTVHALLSIILSIALTVHIIKYNIF